MKEQDAQAKLSLKLQAYQYLKTKILNCEYRPNEFLNEQKLCAEMGNISRTPMRDALGRLEQEGLIYPVRGKGNFVAETTRIQEKSRGDFRKEFLELVKKGLQTGVTEEEMLSLVRKSCEEEQR